MKITLIFIFIFISLFGNHLSSQASNINTIYNDDNENIEITEDTKDLLVLHNNYRQTIGAKPLCLNAKLIIYANQLCNYLANTGDFEHNSKNGSTPITRFNQSGYNWNFLGENIGDGYTTANQVMTAWENSPTHDANIRQKVFIHTGFASCAKNVSGSGLYWVAAFASPPTNDNTEECLE